METTVVSPTIGRLTLADAIASALSEQFPVIVVSDGVELDPSLTERFPEVTFYKLGRQYGFFGAMACNVGVLMAQTEFATLLGDDGEFVAGAGDILRKNLLEDRSVDIWIPGIRYSDGFQRCLRKGRLKRGNVSHPTLRTVVMTKMPIRTFVDRELDIRHIVEATEAGYQIRWVGEACYLIRPKLTGRQGNGQL